MSRDLERLVKLMSDFGITTTLDCTGKYAKVQLKSEEVYWSPAGYEAVFLFDKNTHKFIRASAEFGI